MQGPYFEPRHKHRFYETWWGVMLLGIIIVLAAGLVVFGLQVAKYYKKIQLGELSGQYGGHFTQGKFTPPPRPKEKLAFSAEDDPSFGPKDAPTQIVVFAEFECPFSKEAMRGVRELMIKYPDRFNLIYRDFPLTEVHPNAFMAAEAANCANEQDKFWPMHDKLFQNQDRLTDLDLKLYALQVGLDIVKFNQCLDSQKYKQEIEIDLADGQAAGVIGTPTFFINGVKVAGAIPKEILEKIITSK